MKVVGPCGVSYDIRFGRKRMRSSWGKPVTDTFCTVSLIDPDPMKVKAAKYKLLSKGKAKQNSKDVFNKARGREIALGRAVKPLPSSVKTLLLEAYENRS